MTILTTLKRLVLTAAALAATAVNAASTITYFHNDLAGSPVAATNASGQVIWRESYRPYGERLTNSAASADNKIYFTSRRQDAETGLVYMGARYYDPMIGRFISTDPKQFDEKNPHLFNRYAYANNNPYKYVDPDGQNPWAIARLEYTVVVAVVTRLGAASLGGAIGRGLYDWIHQEGNENPASNSGQDRQADKGKEGEKDPSTPTGRKGAPMDVDPGSNVPTSIDGRDYTGHALDRMQGRGVPPSAVEDAIRNGGTSAGNQPGTTVHSGDNGVTVVTGDRGQVITVIPR